MGTVWLQQAFKQAEDGEQQVIAWRRQIHRHPELGFEEEQTSQLIGTTLKQLGIPYERVNRTGVVGRLIGAQPGRVIALRADMDALPVQEKTGLPFASEIDGKMHACGHDGHTATLLGVAAALAPFRAQLNGEVRFLFQPSEEHFPGGALGMIEAGALDGVDAIFGVHYIAGIPSGKVGIIPGPMMAAPDTFTLKVTGVGGHGSEPEATRDPIPAAAEMIEALQTIVSRRVSPLKQAVVTVGTIHGGYANNVIADEVTMTGTMRSFEEPLRRALFDWMRQIVGGVAAAQGVEADLAIEEGYPPLVNEARMTALVQQAVRNVFGPEGVLAIPPSMGGEDFSYFLQHVPGAFAHVGVHNEAKGIAGAQHSPTFMLDETIFLPTTQLFLQVVADFLENGLSGA
ncbi:MAG: amidohydrolase [Firmicutes bacterium]|nr:amidohydrolase [Bacillota bacterium]